MQSRRGDNGAVKKGRGAGGYLSNAPADIAADAPFLLSFA
jgi:hypothetical protein